MNIIPLPDLPLIPSGSPQLVQLLDDIRSSWLDDEENDCEFYWFAREYPRIYRHHVEHAEHRLRAIHDAYVEFHGELSEEVSRRDVCREMLVSRYRVKEMYWDFEAFLNAVSSSLDTATRVVGPAYKTETPMTFNRFFRSASAGRLHDLFETAAHRWVLKLKDYRDCFVHYTPTNTILFFGIREYSDGWEVRAQIPQNPNERDILGFRKGRRYDVLKYVSTVWRHLTAFDRAVSRELRSMYRRGEFPVRTTDLFFKGKRTRPALR